MGDGGRSAKAVSIGERLRGLDSQPHYLARGSLLERWRATDVLPAQTLPQAIRQTVFADPDVLVVFGSRERPWEGTIGALYEDSLEIARGLARLGLVEGDVVAVQVPNWREGMLALLAALELGLIVIPVLHTNGPAELGYILNETRAAALILPDRWKKIDYLDRVDRLPPAPDLRVVVVVGDALPGDSRAVSWDSLRGDRASALPEPKARPSDACLINFTSGTTAQPKGVVHSHEGLIAECHFFPTTPSPVGKAKLQPLPSGHIAATLANLHPFLGGGASVFLDQYQEDLALELIHRHAPDRVGGVPMMADFLLNHAAELFPDGLVQMSIGGASVPPEIVRRADSLNCPATRLYGSSEHPTISGSAPDDPLAKRIGTDGPLLPHVGVRIVDDEGRELASGQAGEIVSMGPDLCKGYLSEADNAAAFTADGWFRTGDMGVLDQDGFLTIVDRKKDIIIRGGENLSSKEIEDTLARHAAVAEVAAIAWPDPRYGEKAGVFVRLRPGGALDLGDVKAHFQAAGLSIQKTPEYLVLVDDFPRTAAGKILKTELRRQVRELQPGVGPTG